MPVTVERRPPASLVVARELEVEALVRHPDGDPAEARLGVEVGAQHKNGTVSSERKAGESESCSWPRWSSTLFDDLVGPPQHRLRNGQPESLGGLQIDHQLKLRGLLDGKLRRLGTLED